jgi:hypothetical protein
LIIDITLLMSTPNDVWIGAIMNFRKGAVAAIALATVGGLTLPSASAQAAADCSTPTLVNGSFETFTLANPPFLSGPAGSVMGDWMNDWEEPKHFLFLDLDLPPQALPGWSTTNSDNIVELQRQLVGFEQTGTLSNFDRFAVQPADGSYWGELNSTQDAALYQDVALTAGTEYTWSIKHHGRVLRISATDEMRVSIGLASGAPGSLVAQTAIRKYAPINDNLFSGEPLYSNVFTTETTIEGALEDGWQMFRGTFTPVSSGTYRFEFRALRGLSPTVSNLLDDIEFAPTECVSDPAGSEPEGAVADAELPANPRIALHFRGIAGQTSEGAVVDVSGLRLPDGSAATVSLFAPEVKLFEQVLNTRAFERTVALPAGLAPGSYTVMYRVVLPSGEVLALHVVVKVGAGGVITSVSENVVGSGPAELASTGVTSSSLPWWAIITVFGGLMFIVYSRRAVKMAESVQPSLQ